MSPVAIGSGAGLGTALGLMTGGALASAALIVRLRPWLVRYALARPSARGLHITPTPQGGGIAVLIACTGVVAAGAWLFGLDPADVKRVAAVLAAAAGLAVMGLLDDIRPIAPAPRLLLQLALMGIGVTMLPEGTRVLPFLPATVEYAVLVVGGAWFINLTNFMDGMDGITVADTVPLTAALALFWALGDLAPVAGLIALGLLGGMVGYSPFNKPVARLFLGDVGSLPVGFLVAFGLFSLAGHGGGGMGPLSAAVMLALYPIADSGITLGWRLTRGERVWEPHRSHFYQVAVLRGRSVWQVLARVAAANIVFVGLAWTALRCGPGLRALAIVAAIGTVAAVLIDLGKAPGARGEP